MIPEARSIWAGLQFRMPMMLRNVQPLSEEQLHWTPGRGRNSIAWQLWHIAEVEDNWPAAVIGPALRWNDPPRYPFGIMHPRATREQYPSKGQLLDYLHDVRRRTPGRLERLRESDMDVIVHDPDYQELTVRDVWAGVVTSFAWHAGQIALTAKLIPNTPVSTLRFSYADDPRWRGSTSG